MGVLFVALCLTPTLLAALRRRLDVGEPLHFFLGYMALSLGLRGLFLIGHGSYIVSPLLDPGSEHLRWLMTYAYAVALAGVAAFLAGYHATLGPRLGARLPLVHGSWSPAGLKRSTAVAALIGLLGVLLFMGSLGNDLSRVLALLPAIARQRAGEQYFYFPLMWFWIVGYLVLWAYLVRGPATSTAKYLFGAYSAGVAFLFLITGSKWLVFTLIITGLLCYHYLRKPIRPLTLAVVLGVFLASWPLFYAYQGVHGDMTSLPSTALAYAREGLFAQVLGRSYGMDSLLVIIHRVAHLRDLRFGGTMRDIFFFYVPRLLWSTKPVSFSQQFATDYLIAARMAPGTFASPSLIGELYLNFHVVGVVVVMFLIGVLQRASYVYLKRDAANPATVLIYSLTLLAFVHLVEGSISAQVETWLSWLVPLLVVLALMGRPVRRPAQSGQSLETSETTA